MGLFLAKGFKISSTLGLGLAQKIARCLLHQGHLPLDNPAIIDVINRKSRHIGHVSRIEITGFHQLIQADQQRIAGKGRK